jgi:hypothetical protein
MPAIQPLETIQVTFKPFNTELVIPLEVIPDTGANVTAIPTSAVKEIQLDQPNIVL